MGMVDRKEISSNKAATIGKAENGIPLADSPGIAQKRIELFEREQYESILKARFFSLKTFYFLEEANPPDLLAEQMINGFHD